MSTKTKKAKPPGKKSAPAEAPKAEKPKTVMPTGRLPSAIVSARNGSETVERPGRGFSRAELSEGGLPLRLASRWGVPFDSRRRSTVQANVSALKKWYSPQKRAEGASKPAQSAPKKRAPRKKEA